MSGEREDDASQQPFPPPSEQPFANSKPPGDFRKKSDDLSGGMPEGTGQLRPWKAPSPEDEAPPQTPVQDERAGEGRPSGEREASPHAGKFYERYVKRPKGKRPDSSERPDDRAPSRPERSLQSSEHTQRIPSSATARSYDDRRDAPSRDPRARPFDREQRNSGPPSYPPSRPSGPYDSRRDERPRSSGGYDSGPRRDAYPPRDAQYPQRDTRQYDDRRDAPSRDPRDRPFDREQRSSGPPAYAPSRPSGPYDSRRDERPRFSGGGGYDSDPRRDVYPPRDTRQYDDRRDAPRPRDDFRPPDRRDDRRGSYTHDDRRPAAPAGPAPHLSPRIIRSEGAKADQRPLPPERSEREGPISAARDLAARVLLRRLQGNAFVEDLLDDAFTTTKMRPDDRRLAQELVYGCVRWQTTLDWLIARKTEGRPQQPNVQVFLRLGLYQLFFLDRVPPHAACYETVEIAKRHGLEFQANFINAILRRSDAERATLAPELAELKSTQPDLGYSHPDWLVQRWTERWGPEDTRRLLEWNNTAPPTHVRVNTIKSDPTKLIERWRLHENVEYDFVRCPWTDEGHVFTLKTHPSIANLDSFRDGSFYVQDPSTLLAVQALDPWAGENILDLCAAPGGKTCYIAQKMENDGELLACDLTADRLRLVTENCTRLGVTCVKTLALGDHPEAALIQMKFDKVLVDAPCSNTGVLRRRIDLRWRLQPEEIARLRATQLKLLTLAAAHLNPGGTLVYSTCSLEPEENAEVVQEFLATHPQFKLESEQSLLPFRDGVDGAYVAKLKS